MWIPVFFSFFHASERGLAGERKDSRGGPEGL